MRSFPPFLLCCAAATLGLSRPLARADSAAPTAPAAPSSPAVPAPAPTAWTSDRQLDALARAVSEHFNLDGDLRLALLRPWISPAGTAVSWQVEVVEFPIEPTANMVLRYRLLRDGAVAEESSLMVRAALWRDAWFARQPIPAGTIFGPALLDTRRIDCFRERDGLPVTAGNASYIFSRDLPADRLVTWHDLARRPLVHKGEVVEVVAGEGSLSLTMKALALESGARGDLVTVKNLESNKDISAQVIDDSRVEVHF